MRPPLWTLFAIPLLALAGWFVFMNLGSFVPAPPTAQNGSARLLNCEQIGEGDVCGHGESTPHYVISLMYPRLEGNKQQIVERNLLEVVHGFKADLTVMLDEAEKARLEAEGRRYELTVNYQPYEGSGYESYEFDIYIDTGGAHPNGFYKTVVFDAQGREVEFETLFKPGSNYLERLSVEAYKQVLAELSRRTGVEISQDMEDTVRIGTAPTPETLQFFVIDGSDLVLLFPPYQVAAYAAGSFEVRIPLATMQDVLK